MVKKAVALVFLPKVSLSYIFLFKHTCSGLKVIFEVPVIKSKKSKSGVSIETAMTINLAMCASQLVYLYICQDKQVREEWGCVSFCHATHMSRKENTGGGCICVLTRLLSPRRGLPKRYFDYPALRIHPERILYLPSAFVIRNVCQRGKDSCDRFGNCCVKLYRAAQAPRTIIQCSVDLGIGL